MTPVWRKSPRPPHQPQPASSSSCALLPPPHSPFSSSRGRVPNATARRVMPTVKRAAKSPMVTFVLLAGDRPEHVHGRGAAAGHAGWTSLRRRVDDSRKQPPGAVHLATWRLMLVEILCVIVTLCVLSGGQRNMDASDRDSGRVLPGHSCSRGIWHRRHCLSRRSLARRRCPHVLFSIPRNWFCSRRHAPHQRRSDLVCC